MARVLIVGGTDESRLMLRGLLRLHLHDVVGEGRDSAALSRLGDSEGPLVVVVDADLENREWSEAVQQTFARCAKLRGVLITPDRSPRMDARAKAVGITELVHRPFGVQELMEAVGREAERAAGSPAPPSGTAPVDQHR